MKQVIIALGGAKGVGKSLLVKKLKLRLNDFLFISTGDFLKKLAYKQYCKNFVELDRHQKTKIRNIFAKLINKQKQNLLLDLHYGEFEDGGYPCVIHSQLQGKITHYILLKTNPKTILLRRFSDNSKSRRVDLTSIRLNLIGEELLFKQLTKHKINKISLNNKSFDLTAEKIINFIKK